MRRRRPIRPRSGLPDAVRSERERRELLVSHGIVALLQLGIAIALAVAAVQTYHMWRQDVPYIPREVARAVPWFLFLGTAMATLAAGRALRRVRVIQRLPLEAPPEP
jgi:hypothetical protein